MKYEELKAAVHEYEPFPWTAERMVTEQGSELLDKDEGRIAIGNCIEGEADGILAETAALIVHWSRTYDALLEALKSQRYATGEQCFCEVSIDNPMLKGKHTESCKKAMAALERAEKLSKEDSK